MFHWQKCDQFTIVLQPLDSSILSLYLHLMCYSIIFSSNFGSLFTCILYLLYMSCTTSMYISIWVKHFKSNCVCFVIIDIPTCILLYLNFCWCHINLAFPPLYFNNGGLQKVLATFNVVLTLPKLMQF